MQCMADCFACIAATCILFGDGTGAMVLTAQQGQCSLLGIDAHSDGGGQKHLNVSLLVSAPESQNQCRLHEHMAGHQSQPGTCSVSADGLILVIGAFCHPVLLLASFPRHTDTSASKQLLAAADLILYSWERLYKCMLGLECSHCISYGIQRMCVAHAVLLQSRGAKASQQHRSVS